MHLRCVVRVESIKQDIQRVLGRVLSGMLHGHSPREVPMAGACNRERSWGGLSLWDEAPGWRCYLARGTGCHVEWGIGSLLVKTSYSVIIRTGMP
jgi:hypothetical protein